MHMQRNVKQGACIKKEGIEQGAGSILSTQHRHSAPNCAFCFQGIFALWILVFMGWVLLALLSGVLVNLLTPTPALSVILEHLEDLKQRKWEAKLRYVPQWYCAEVIFCVFEKHILEWHSNATP